ncbi:hypothetical protein ACFSUS_25115 [Spirosoma soli]|uniref:Curlin associated repeat-containing protein n=1 Tax=Spirosoma soli TaxID=1770529 RepID=A0ABW5MA92_9BACT
MAAGDPAGNNPSQNSKNTSTINQTGDGSGGNTANVTQVGTSNATANQIGHNNTADIDQQNNGGRSGIGFENDAIINQGVGGAAQDNYARILQKGHTNDGTVNQTGSSHEAYIDQQSALRDGQATITQSGQNHLASIVQNGSTVGESSPGAMDNGNYGPNTATITQSGTDQIGYVTQLTDGNTATVEQSGLSNEAYVNQGTAGETPGTAGDHKALVQQFGTDDYVSINQTGRANEVKTYQTEYDNRIVVTQSNGLNKAAMSQQDGNSNRANITQSGNNNTVQGLSDEYARQSGNGNQFTSNQTGGFGVIQLGQTGTNNIANVTQAGGGTLVP